MLGSDLVSQVQAVAAELRAPLGEAFRSGESSTLQLVSRDEGKISIEKAPHGHRIRSIRRNGHPHRGAMVAALGFSRRATPIERASLGLVQKPDRLPVDSSTLVRLSCSATVDS
jgi:hypothetical protein